MSKRKYNKEENKRYLKIMKEKQKELKEMLKGRCITNKDVILNQDRKIVYLRLLVDKMISEQKQTQTKIKYIVEQYVINNQKYQILYKEDAKANEVFNALNRIIASNKDRDYQDNIQIIKIKE